MALSRASAMVAIAADTGVGELVGAFDHGIAAWNGEVLLPITLVEVESENDKQQPEMATATTGKKLKLVLLTMNAEWNILAKVDIKTHDPQHPVYATIRPPNGTLLSHGLGQCWMFPIVGNDSKKGLHQQQVAFIEPNGLRHGEFLLHHTSTTLNTKTDVCKCLRSNGIWNQSSWQLGTIYLLEPIAIAAIKNCNTVSFSGLLQLQ